MGARYLVLVVLGASGALALARYFNLGAAATAVTVLLGLAPAYIAWAAFRADRTEAAAMDLDTASAQLAVAVKNQWDGEATHRGVNESSALPVAWRPVEPRLVEDWADVINAARGLPGRPRACSEAWTMDVAELSGTYTQIGAVFAQRVPTRRMVVLGEPGSGKTVLLIRLLQELIAQPEDGAPVPVLFSLASWDPYNQDLRTWMAEQLRRMTNVGLRNPALAGLADETDLAQALVNHERILPLLDGFDEIPSALHAEALHQINRGWRTQPLILASRSDVYREALDRPGARRLNGATGIQLLPLEPEQAARYLRHTATGERERWDEVIAHLGSDTPVGHTLSSPLGLFLASTIYSPLPRAEEAGPIPHPDELCDTSRFRTRIALERHLFSGFISAAYDPRDKPRWSAQQAHHTLAVFARYLQAHRGGSTDLAWWEFGNAVPVGFHVFTVALVSGLIGAVTIGLVVGVSFGLSLGFVGMLAGGPVAACASLLGLANALGAVYPGTGLRLSAFMFGLLAAPVAVVLVFVLADARIVQYAGLVTGAILWTTLTEALRDGGDGVERPNLAVRIGPGTLLAQDRRTFFQIVLAFALVGGPLGVFAFGLTGAFPGVPAFGIGGGLAVGLTVGLAYGFAAGFRETAWAQYAAAAVCLARLNRVPWNLMAFLQDAHEDRGVLRQVGTVYQFRHVDLQRFLASNPPHRGNDD